MPLLRPNLLTSNFQLPALPDTCFLISSAPDTGRRPGRCLSWARWWGSWWSHHPETRCTAGPCRCAGSGFEAEHAVGLKWLACLGRTHPAAACLAQRLVTVLRDSSSPRGASIEPQPRKHTPTPSLPTAAGGAAGGGGGSGAGGRLQLPPAQAGSGLHRARVSAGAGGWGLLLWTSCQRGASGHHTPAPCRASGCPVRSVIISLLVECHTKQELTLTRLHTLPHISMLQARQIGLRVSPGGRQTYAPVRCGPAASRGRLGTSSTPAL